MKEHPILFNAPMVRAILNGVKSQTRRAVKLNAAGRVEFIGRNWHCDDPDARLACPYGQPGDRLWVREAFAYSVIDPEGLSPEDDPENYDIIYRATDQPAGGWSDGEGSLIKAPWKPSIHMPRNCSRITLEIVSARVERLQDISDPDALAEGCSTKDMRDGDCLASVYARLWESLNGAGAWAENPWVWVVEFRRLP